MKKRALFITLARGGSKSVPLKNLAKINGIPLLKYTFDAVKPCVEPGDDYIVSTDSQEIKSFCIDNGIQFINRPNVYATDDATSAGAIRHALTELLPTQYQYIVECMATNPFKTSADISMALQTLIRHPEVDSVVSVKPVEDSHPARLKYIQNGILMPFFPEELESPRQTLRPHAYIRNGAIYAFRTDSFISTGTRVGKVCMPYIMNQKNVNIDSMEDLFLAEILLQKQYKN